ncbi:hypothetical protein R3P38DRAFT_3308303 [Favolaschia claudopus]|uniref:Uncharacterized protein n=1 Tax=Favolaschia claudopus TaxID=2862362 RepID=A0AAW0CZR4_9AGAR
MPQEIQIDIHTHIHHHLPPTMTAAQPPSSAVPQTELQELIALVSRLSAASTEAMRLAVETISLILLKQLDCPLCSAATTAAQAAAAQAAAAQATAAQAAAAPPPPPSPPPAHDFDEGGPIFVRGVPLTPAELETAHPPGSGETWYVVIRGREPGMYHSAKLADAQCNGVPYQLKAKKTSRIQALDYYREHYQGPDSESGVQKWIEP